MQVDAGMGVRNYVLIRAKQRLDALEHMKFNILVKSTQLDRSNTEEVQKFNDLLREYDKLRNPEKAVSPLDLLITSKTFFIIRSKSMIKINQANQIF